MLRQTIQAGRKIDLLDALDPISRSHLNFNETYNCIFIKLSNHEFYKWGYTTFKLTMRCTDNYNTGVYDYVTEYILHTTDLVKFSRISIKYTDLISYDQPYFVSPIFLMNNIPYIAIWKNRYHNVSPIVDLTLEYVGSSRYQVYMFETINSTGISAQYYKIDNLLKYSRTQGKYDLYDCWNSSNNITTFKDLFKNLKLNILKTHGLDWISMYENQEIINGSFVTFSLPKNKYDFIKISTRRSAGFHNTVGGAVAYNSEWPCYNGTVSNFYNLITNNLGGVRLHSIKFNYTQAYNYYTQSSASSEYETINKIELASESRLIKTGEDDLYVYLQVAALNNTDLSASQTPDNVIKIEMRDPTINPFVNSNLSDMILNEQKKRHLNHIGVNIRCHQSRATTSFINSS